ncbi:MAG: hypothetical protein GC159_13885 [Phycisphaera sp.]|nr:hypothetical protein [Phycisphaera sp.]
MAKTKATKTGKKTTKKRPATKAAGKSSKKKSSKKSSTKKSAGKKVTTKKKSAAKSPAKKSKPATKTAKTSATSPKKVAKRTTKKKTNAAKSTDAAPKTKSTSRRKVKTPLKAKDLNYFAHLLLLKRAEILGDMDSMHKEALNVDSANLSHMPLHMADIGSDNYEQELTLGMLEEERKRLGEINDALMRIKDRTYGVCLETGAPINRARLEAKPWAKYCIEAARAMERKGRM